MWRPAAPVMALALSLVWALACAAPAFAQPADGLDRRERNFLNEAAILNLTEMHAGKLAEDLAETEEVRALARRLATSHASAHERLRAIAQKHGVTLPDNLDAPTREQIGEMQTFTGPAFDRYFLSFQEETHLRALKLFDAQVAYQGDEGLHHYAETTLGQLNDHLRTVVDATAAIARTQDQAQDPQQSAEQPPR
ncbi:DUF4142 domain-containing protein [Azospirillum sp.]|uniref:DUF4142 domain-containing protein n=1 Tax=Azospirillum sp. TaxID=34012 RepID=UPI003D73F31E